MVWFSTIFFEAEIIRGMADNVGNWYLDPKSKRVDKLPKFPEN